MRDIHYPFFVLVDFFSFQTATKEKKQKNAAYYNWIMKIIAKKIIILITKTFFMLKLMSTILSFLLLPVSLLIYGIKTYILEPIARLVLHKEIKEENAKRESSYKEARRLNEKLEKTMEENKGLRKRLGRIVEIVKNNPQKKLEIALSEKEEIVIFAHRPDKIFDTIHLFGEKGDHPFHDCKIDFHTRGNDLKIADFGSYKPGHGYGRALLNYTIKKAREKNYHRIEGDLSPVDAGNFNWLIPFYTSMGFTCRLFKEHPTGMDGIISMTL